jgi:NTE family protein
MSVAPRNRWNASAFPILCCALALLAGCSTAHYSVNVPLTRDRADDGYRTRSLRAPANSDSLSVLLTLSGGGYRAATMAYAALEVLRDTRIDWEGESRSVLQELDIVSAVSGGSLAAAYYALNSERFFDDFRPRLLGFDLQSALLSRALSPPGLWRQTSPTFGRGDILQELLDERVFGGRTFGDLPRRRPMVYLNATDMRVGDRFEFSQDPFDHICSDLDPFPVARAVAASMAVPVLLSPITLWNYRDRCTVDLRPPPVSGRSAASRYIHLLDGGLSDNTGVRMALENVAARGGLARAARLAGFHGVRVRAIIGVNAQVDPRDSQDESPSTPGVLRQLRSVINVPIDRYSASSLQALADAVQQWQVDPDRNSAARAGADGFDEQIHLIEIGVGTAHATEAAEAVRNIPTSLRIDEDQIETIRRFVRDEFDANPAWHRLLDRLNTARPSLKAAELGPLLNPVAAP